jgi:hypothetical protein
MKNLILVFMTLISLCCYSQRDTSTIPFYLYVKDLKEDYYAVKYYIAEVISTNELSNGETETLNFIKENICYYDYDKDAVLFNLGKNKYYKISVKKGDITVNTYIETSKEEPKKFLSLDIDFDVNEHLEVYYDNDTNSYVHTSQKVTE